MQFQLNSVLMQCVDDMRMLQVQVCQLEQPMKSTLVALRNANQSSCSAPSGDLIQVVSGTPGDWGVDGHHPVAIHRTPDKSQRQNWG